MSAPPNARSGGISGRLRGSLVEQVSRENPYVLEVRGEQKVVDYEPAESQTGIFGGNSNWRGPVWFPINYLLIESLQKFHHYYGDDFKVECPTGSGQFLTSNEIANELSNRLIKLWLRDGNGERPFARASGDSLGGEGDRDRYFFMNIFTATPEQGSVRTIRPGGPVWWQS